MLIATLSLALILAGRGSITIGDAAVAIVGLQQLSSRLQSAGHAFSGVHEGVTFLARLREVPRHACRSSVRAARAACRRRPPTVAVGRPPRLPVPGRRSDDAARATSASSSRRGQVMAIVGANGSGKTTLAKLLCDLLPPHAGTVAWDGVDLAGCDPSLVRAQIAPVFQDYARYLLTIRQAIGLGDVAAPRRRGGDLRGGCWRPASTS